MENKEFCLTCGGHHTPDPEDSYVEFRSYRFHSPFRCICCGKVVCARQFAFGRACGLCDVGACQSNNRAFTPHAAHAHPEWWAYDGGEMFRRFVEIVRATPIEEERDGQANP